MTGRIKSRPMNLCGGSDARLRELSSYVFLKQFLFLTGKERLCQNAIKGSMGLSADGSNGWPHSIVTNEEHRFLALEQLREIGKESGAALLEPVARNIATALTLAALAAVENGDDSMPIANATDQTRRMLRHSMSQYMTPFQKLDLTTKTSFAAIVREGLKAAGREKLTKKSSFKAMNYHEWAMPLKTHNNKIHAS